MVILNIPSSRKHDKSSKQDNISPFSLATVHAMLILFYFYLLILE